MRTAPAGDRLLEVVERTDGGVFQSICSLDWEAAFREMSAAAFGFPQCFFLTDVPADLNADGAVREADGELEVRLDGEVVHERGAQGQNVWDYDQDRNALCFRPLATPEPGSTIDVGYHPVCP